MIPLRDIRRRIRSVEKISQITKAMKTVAAIRLMKVQNQVLKQKPYATKIREVVGDLVARTPQNIHPMLTSGLHSKTETDDGDVPKTRNKRIIVAIVLGSDRGLCGSFNHNLAVEAQKFLQVNKDSEVKLVVIGKRIRDLIRVKKQPIFQEKINFYHDMTFNKVVTLAQYFLREYMQGEINEMFAIYTEFRTTAKQKVTTQQLLPIGLKQVSSEPLFPTYIYEPDAFTILDNILPMYYNREVWRIFLESTASEHIARMVAMDMATINALEMIEELTLSYNKVRQESITRELSEISTAAETFRAG
jgi:F-type H+-transporting ATPase subunit gamma